MSKEVKKSGGNGIDLSKLGSSDIKDVFVSLVNAKKEYEITREQEHTKREAIDADLRKYLTKVNDTKELLSSHLAEQYSLRRDTIEQLFNLLDRSIHEEKENVAIQILTTLEGIVKESPLKEVEKIGKAFASDGELEI